MARMIPESMLKGDNSPAEELVFKKLKEELSDDYTVIHSVDLYHKSSVDDRLKPGEADFLIIKPGKGLVIVEVKGGEIERNANSNQWFSVDRRGNVHEIKDPYNQSLTNCKKLERQLTDVRDLQRYKFPCSNAVWFPEVSIQGRNFELSPVYKQMTLDCTAFENVEKSISRLFTNSFSRQINKCCGPDAMKCLIKYLAPNWKFTKRLNWSIQQGEEKILEATKSQYRILSLLQRTRKALFCGPAGSGKTMLILEKAARFAQANMGSKVLVLCFNKNLSLEMEKALCEFDQIETYNFHRYCDVMAERAKLKIKDYDASDGNAYFNDYFPELLSQALEKLDLRYDCILVDEGQDFKAHWWLPIEDSLAHPDESTFYIFYDDNQNIYNKKHSFPFDSDPLHLEENCRNTKHIHNEAMQFYQGEVQPVSAGPQGKPPAVYEVKNHIEEKEVLDKVINHLVAEEKVSPGLITILTPKGQQNSGWKRGEAFGGCQLYWSDDERKGKKCIRVSTIHSFKGLENDIIILTELDGLQPWMRKQLMYVGTSRAKMHLVIIKIKEM